MRRYERKGLHSSEKKDVNQHRDGLAEQKKGKGRTLSLPGKALPIGENEKKMPES